MKSFFEMMHEWNFVLALALAFILAGWNIMYGVKWLGVFLVVLIMGLIALNIWKTRGKKET